MSAELCVCVEVGSVLCRFVSELGAFDLCLTAGPGEDVSVGSCGRLISPALTQAQLVDSTLWDSARKLSRPRQINHWRGFLTGFCKLWPQWPVPLCLLTLSYGG